MHIRFALFICWLLPVAACGPKQPKTVQPGLDTVHLLQTAPEFLTQEEIDQRLQLEPGNPDLYYFRALYNYTGGDFISAIEDFDQAIQLDSTFVSAYHDRGAAKYELNRLEAAIADYSKAIELDSTYPDYFTNRGMAYNKLGNTELAISDFSEAIERDSSFALGWLERGKARLFLKRKDGCDDLKKALELGAKEAEAELKNTCQ